MITTEPPPLPRRIIDGSHQHKTHARPVSPPGFRSTATCWTHENVSSSCMMSPSVGLRAADGVSVNTTLLPLLASVWLTGGAAACTASLSAASVTFKPAATAEVLKVVDASTAALYISADTLRLEATPDAFSDAATTVQMASVTFIPSAIADVLNVKATNALRCPQAPQAQMHIQ